MKKLTYRQLRDSVISDIAESLTEKDWGEHTWVNREYEEGFTPEAQLAYDEHRDNIETKFVKLEELSRNVEVIQIIDEGIAGDPEIFLSEALAGRRFEEVAVSVGFRAKEEKEKWMDYATSHREWEEDSINNYEKPGGCKYDPVDWELHWWTDIKAQ